MHDANHLYDMCYTHRKPLASCGDGGILSRRSREAKNKKSFESSMFTRVVTTSPRVKKSLAR